MKKIVIIFFILSISILKASNDDIYVLFTSTENVRGIRHASFIEWEDNVFRYRPHIFYIFDFEKGYHLIFGYFNRLDEPDKPVQKEDESFLNGKHRIDWDVASGTFADREQAETQISNHILCYDNIYFIDKCENETFEEQVVENGNLVTRTRTLITIYPVDINRCNY